MIEGKRILITGGAGFIGSHLAEALLPGNRVTIFDNFARNALVDADLREDRRLSVVEGDVLDESEVRAVVRGHDVIFHCAAIAGIDTVGKSPVRTLKVNIVGSLHVLDAAMASGRVDRVVCFSTSEIYGRNADLAAETDDAKVGPIGEPRWTYAAGKLAEEHLAAAYHAEHGLPTVVLRPFNVYGPRQVGEGAIRTFLIRALRGQPLEIRGTGTAIRAWTYVSDMVTGALAAAIEAGAVGEAFNIGNADEPLTVLELAERVRSLTSSESEIVNIPAPDVDVEERVPDIGKARRVLGFRPQVGLDEGIRYTAKFLEGRL